VYNSAKPAQAAGPPTPIRTLVPLTIDPARLLLDLRILAFIEAVRTVPLGPTSSIMSTSPTPPSEISTDAPAERDLATLLGHISDLHERMQSLDDPADRADYKDQIDKVSMLLAYKVPEGTPASKYLSQSRREDVATEINCAMLC
jgi:hypothetical protein